MVIDIYSKVHSQQLLKDELEMVQDCVDNEKNMYLVHIIRRLDSKLDYHKSKTEELLKQVQAIQDLTNEVL